MSSVRLFFLISAGLVLASCADVIEANGPTTRIYSEPEVARCDLKGTDFARTVRTPIRVILPKSASPITVTCTADGFRPANHVLNTAISNAVSSNMLIGSSLGLIVDIMTGAAEQYPTSVRVHLEPEAFASEADRDEWYGRFRQSIDSKWSGVVEKLRIECAAEEDSRQTCLEELDAARGQRMQALSEVESRRAEAPVHMKAQARSVPAPR